MNHTSKRKLNNKGAAMVLTVVIILVVMIFVFSLILVSYNLYASQTKNLTSTRNAEAVNTLSNALADELTDGDAYLNSNLWKYIRYNIAYNDTSGDWEDWPCYLLQDDGITAVAGHDRNYACRYFTVDNNSNIEGTPAVTTVCIYWMPPEGMDAVDFATAIAANPISAKNGLRLIVETTAQTANQVYRVTDIYELSVNKITDAAKIQELRLEGEVSEFNPVPHTVNYDEDWTFVHVERK